VGGRNISPPSHIRPTDHLETFRQQMFTKLVLNKIEGKLPDESCLSRGETAMSTTCAPGLERFPEERDPMSNSFADAIRGT
jgi:hypothetical protein